ncbi:mitochondrial 37S ribosomal protein mS38 [Lipomyces chichibuensis]|uniref:mitochondrial 37S ribosomal protein mS38 n=1 Tax=Lipomyces chichibuensis TaxID=1546026 RepID=UPI003343661F
MVSRAILQSFARNATNAGYRARPVLSSLQQHALSTPATTAESFSSRSRRYSSSSSSSSSASSKFPKPSRGRKQLKKLVKRQAEVDDSSSKTFVSKSPKAPATNHVSLSSLAYDSFFTGFRPLHLSNSLHNSLLSTEALSTFTPFSELPAALEAGDEDSMVNLDMEPLAFPLGTTSASGQLLDPVMKSLPYSALEQLRSNRPPPPPGVEPSRESGISDAAMKMVEVKFSQGIDLDGENADMFSAADIVSTLKCIAAMDVDFKSIRELQKRLDEKGDSAIRVMVGVVGPDGSIEGFRPLQLGRKNRRPLIRATSVMRKRKLKIKKHKLRKRRKAQRALKRKLS